MLSIDGFHQNPRVKRRRRESSSAGLRPDPRLLTGAPSLDQLQTQALHPSFVPQRVCSDQYRRPRHGAVEIKEVEKGGRCLREGGVSQVLEVGGDVRPFWHWASLQPREWISHTSSQETRLREYGGDTAARPLARVAAIHPVAKQTPTLASLTRLINTALCGY